MYLKDGAVDDGAHRLCVLSPLGVGGAGVGRGSLRKSTAGPGKLPGKGGHAVLHVSLWGGEVIVLVPR